MGPPAETVRHLLQQTPQSISLHIRRGDYAKDPATQAYHGIQPIEYYRKAINIISEKLMN